MLLGFVVVVVITNSSTHRSSCTLSYVGCHLALHIQHQFRITIPLLIKLWMVGALFHHKSHKRKETLEGIIVFHMNL